MDVRDVMRRLNTALSRIDFAYARLGKKYGLTFNSLMAVYVISAREYVTQQLLCEALNLPKSTVHSILKEFMKDGYVKLQDGADKREKQISVTAVGHSFFASINAETNMLEASALRFLDEDKCDALLNAAENLADIISCMGIGEKK